MPKVYIQRVKKYSRPPFFVSPHLETIYPALFRRVQGITYQRERIETPDDDFLDLDWIREGNSRLVIISHGLEGDSHRPYVRGMARAFSQQQYDVMAWNFRGCSGEMNRTLRFYHSGATDDLDLVVRHARTRGYRQISLIGFSLGGNLTLKYLGEQGPEAEIDRAMAISVPLDLRSSCARISQPGNYVYSRRFLRNLSAKIRRKAALMPDELDETPLNNISTLMEFDDAYTAPIHGFRNALDYYEKCSSINFLSSICVPVLILNAANDPFLTPECYPRELVSRLPLITLEIPEYGGHVGFTSFGSDRRYWSENRALRFMESND